LLKLRTQRAVFLFAFSIMFVSVLLANFLFWLQVDLAIYLDRWLITTRIAMLIGGGFGWFCGHLIRKNVMMGDALQFMIDHDVLTGCDSRRKFFEAVSDELLYPACVIVIDLDHFKQVNDSLGHEGGDKALVHFARTLRLNMRSDDMFARLGGEEFVILLPRTDLMQGQGVAWRLCLALRAVPFDFGDSTRRLTASFGVAQVSGPHEIDFAVQAGDLAMYAAKAAGRDRVCVQVAIAANTPSDPRLKARLSRA
jgi:diguanylate cyclase (GGDEF)-like protein